MPFIVSCGTVMCDRSKRAVIALLLSSGLLSTLKYPAQLFCAQQLIALPAMR